MQQPQTILNVSDLLYRRFLVAYPAEYRQELSDEMAQVFRDLSREVYEQRGLAGFLELWLATMFDLFKTALEERIKETTNMSKGKFIRLGGWALMLAGILLWLGFAASEVPAAKYYSADDPYEKYNYYSDPFGGGDVLYEVAPIALVVGSMLFYTIGFHGLRLRFGDDSGALGNTGLMLATISGAVGTIASIPMMISATEVWWSVWLYSLLLMFGGLFLFGIACLQRKTLPRWNALPMLVGVLLPGLFIAGLAGIPQASLDATSEVIFWITIIGTLALGYLLQRKPEPKMAAA